MKKILTILVFAMLLASCKQNAEKIETPTNTGSSQVETQKVAETPKNAENNQKKSTNNTISNTENVFETKVFSLKLPKGFEGKEMDDHVKIMKTGTEEIYFVLGEWSKEDSEKIKKCEKQEVVNGQKLCDLTHDRGNILTLNYLENPKNGQLLMINEYLEPEKYGVFGVKPLKEAKTEQEHSAEMSRVQKEILQYFKENLTFKK